jgi:hypothetical protein
MTKAKRNVPAARAANREGIVLTDEEIGRARTRALLHLVGCIASGTFVNAPWTMLDHTPEMAANAPGQFVKFLAHHDVKDGADFVANACAAWCLQPAQVVAALVYVAGGTTVDRVVRLQTEEG